MKFGELYPFHANYLDIDGHKLHYLDQASEQHRQDKNVLLMLHGNPTWSFYYRNLIVGLRESHRVVVPDHIGCGFSDKPQQYPYTLATHIRNVERLVDHLQLERVTLVVHDWGGAIGFGWAIRHPQRYERAVVFNTGAFLGNNGPLRIRLCSLPLIGEVVICALNGFAGPAIYMATNKRERMTRAVRTGLLAPYDSYANRIAVLRFVRDIPYRRSVPSYPVIEQIQADLEKLADRPMLICWGKRDFCFNDWFLHEWQRRFPNAESHEFEDAGHYVVEDAHESILPLMKKFLEP
ncbi:MAG: alpha/beta fold hydrolase [Planctomycetota bacterium]|jgi:haloalkane dehalogenase